MAEVEGSRGFGVSADTLWAVVADRSRLADWVPTIRLARPAGEGEVHLEGESHGHPYSMDSMLRVGEGDRRLEWGADQDEGYRGWLRVTDRPPGSQVHLHLAVPDGHLGPSPADAVAEIRRGVEEALDRLAALAPPDPR
jgi:hypothetical protein